MRILLSYYFGPNAIPLGSSLASALQALGHEVIPFHSEREHSLQRHGIKWLLRLGRALRLPAGRLAHTRWSNLAWRSQLLEQAVSLHRPDMIWVIRGNGFTPGLLSQLKARYGVRHTLGWWVKSPRDNPDEMRNDRLEYDAFACIYPGQADPERGIHWVSALAREPGLYHPPASPQPVRYPILLVGRWSPRRQAIAEQLADLPLTIVGPGWRGKNRRKPAMLARLGPRELWGQALLTAYHQSAIVLNITVWDPQQIPALNLRVTDVPACGSFLLTDASPELDALFPAGDGPVSWRDAGELRQLLQHYLDHPDQRQARANLTRSAVERLPTYQDTARRLMELLKHD